MTRIVALGDLHCGHRAGLTPPGWQLPVEGGVPGRNEWGKVQHELWNVYTDIVEAVKPPIDLLIANGDLIDGRGEASGGTELITSNRIAQVEMAVEALRVWEARTIVISYGTPYHTGKLEDAEKLVAIYLQEFAEKVEIHSHPFVSAGGVVFDIKHKVGKSSIPHGRGTAIAKERLWNVLWAEREEQPKADVILRSHVHYFTYIGEADWLAMILPPLQAAGTKYGGRQCSNTIDWGLIEFQADGGEFTWKAHIRRIRANRSRIIKV